MHTGNLLLDSLLVPRRNFTMYDCINHHRFVFKWRTHVIITSAYLQLEAVSSISKASISFIYCSGKNHEVIVPYQMHMVYYMQRKTEKYTDTSSQDVPLESRNISEQGGIQFRIIITSQRGILNISFSKCKLFIWCQ